MDPEEGRERMEDALRVCQSYKLAYMSSKGRVAQYFKEEAAVMPWDFEPDLLFSRLDQFVVHLELVKVRIHTLLTSLKYCGC